MMLLCRGLPSGQAVGPLVRALRPLSTSTLTSVEPDFFCRLLARFPADVPRTLSFGYGSGVFQQAGQAAPAKEGQAPPTKKNMTDLVLSVKDPVEFHYQNLQKNPQDYSNLLRRLGPTLITDLQDKVGARLLFNTLIPFEDGLIKYGVISEDALINDLLDWECLYAAGRMQKPVKILETNEREDEKLSLALRINLENALHTALLLLPESFTEEQLYLTLAGLSYKGDFRMVVGEDKNKVSNIVTPNLVRFRQLYARRLQAMADYVDVSGGDGGAQCGHVCTQDVSTVSRHFHLSRLPLHLRWNLAKEWNRDGRHRDVEDVLRSAALDSPLEHDDIVNKALGNIVKASSVTQAIKGIVSAGFTKTFWYSKAKLDKMFKSMAEQRPKDRAADAEKTGPPDDGARQGPLVSESADNKLDRLESPTSVRDNELRMTEHKSDLAVGADSSLPRQDTNVPYSAAETVHANVKTGASSKYVITYKNDSVMR